MRPAGCRARSAAGVTWTCRTANAPWAARFGHTSVVDAAGAIYVIGGLGSTFFQDVWASTDGGAWPDSVQGGGRGVLKVGTQVGYSSGVRRGSDGVPVGVPGGTQGVAGYSRGALGGTLWSTLGVLWLLPSSPVYSADTVLEH
jgi:hypothetical protein